VGFAKRLLEWFWQGSALARARACLPRRGERAFVWAARAKHSDALAHAAWTTPELGGEAAASELYRQAAYWSLCQLNREELEGAASHEYSDAVWAKLNDRILSTVVEDADERAEFRASLSRADFVYFGELPADEQTAACLKLRNLSMALLESAAEDRRDYVQAGMRRVYRMGALLGVLCAAIITVVVLTRPPNLALGAAWKTSSDYGVPGCTSPEQSCSKNNGYFFHTSVEDKDSWVEFDLGPSKRVSRVVLDNRSDCCAERAIPLAIEVSNAEGHWQKVAERDTPFSRWSAKFPPVLARRVRVHLLHSGPLHLEHVSIF
jgi:hypothetical protein